MDRDRTHLIMGNANHRLSSLNVKHKKTSRSVLALEGIKVIDLTRAGPGPFCTWILGDLGAEVIKIEAPPTVGARQAGFLASSIEGEERRRTIFQVFDRNKKSLGLNLRSEEGRNIFHKLAETADVIIEGFRPGVAKRLGIDYHKIAKINPKIIYCSVTGYGQDGPYCNLPGHDINYISMAGALNLIGERNGKPVVPLNLIADFGGGGMGATIGILSALIARGNTGRGQYVDISLTDTVICLLALLATDYFRDGIIPVRGDVFGSGVYPYYSIYQTKDGKFITLGCMEPWLWENLCRAIEREDLIPFHLEWEHFLHPPKGKKWKEVFAFLRQFFLTKTRDEWFELLSQKDVPIAKVYSLDEVFADPQVLHRKMVIELEHPTEGKVKQVGIAFKLSDTPGRVRGLPPLMGDNTEELLLALGYDKKEIGKLYKGGIVWYRKVPNSRGPGRARRNHSGRIKKV